MTPDAIYELLPAIHRRRDAENGFPLRALLQVIGEQAALIEEDIAQSYEDWFIETCAPWVAPYLGELVGYAPAAEAEPAGARAIRGEVARTIAWARRKGRASLLAELAWSVAGWPGRAVEFGALTEQSQSLRLARPERGRTADLRDPQALARIGTAEDGFLRSADLRGARCRYSDGTPGPSEVGLYVWRLRSVPVTEQPAACREESGPHCFTFSALAADMPLFLRADTGAPPWPLTRARLAAPRPRGALGRADPAYAARDEAGAVSGFTLRAPGWGDAPGADGAIPPERIIPADLADWRYVPPRGHVAVDPELGRIAFPPRQLPRRQVIVSYHQAFSAAIGGGEYFRPLRQPAEARIEVVRGLEQLKAALAPYAGVADAQGILHPADAAPGAHVIEIDDSDVYTLPLALYLPAGRVLQIRAGQRRRPVIRLLDWQVSQADNFFVTGGVGSHLTLDGLLVVGRGIQIEGALASFTLRHATLVPGWALGPHCDPRRPSEPSIELIDSGACLTIDHSITGSIQVNNDEVTTDPVPIQVIDSIVDATGIDCDHPQCEAIGAAGSRLAFARLEIMRSTIIGRTLAHRLDRAENSLFLGIATIARRQLGCMRFCYVPPRSRTPRRFRCQPDLAVAALGPKPAAAAVAGAASAVRPRFDSLRYGNPRYARLARRCSVAITEGAEDRGEMGVFHHLQNPWRLRALARRLEDFTPADSDAGIVFAD